MWSGRDEVIGQQTTIYDGSIGRSLNDTSTEETQMHVSHLDDRSNICLATWVCVYGGPGEIGSLCSNKFTPIRLVAWVGHDAEAINV